MADRLDEVRAFFEPAPGTIYLDAATYGLPPRPTVEAMHRAIDDWQTGTADWVAAWDECGEVCRAAFGRLIGVEAGSIGLLPTVSVAVATIGATVRQGDEIVAPDDEFTSVLFPLLVAARERGATVRQVPFDKLAEHIRPSTTLVAFSLVQSQSGRMADLAAIVAAARANSAATLVDATHAVPFVPISEPVDYLVCAAYKHLLCPRGVAFLHVAPERWATVPPLMANWRSTSDPYGHFYGGPLDTAADAARFDVSLAWFSWVGAAVSLELLGRWQSLGLLADVTALTARLAATLEIPAPGGSVLSVPVDDAEAVRAVLAESGIKAAVRAGSVRLSPHVYNTAHDIDLAAAALGRFARQPVP